MGLKVTRVSPVTGKTNTKELDITEEQLIDYLGSNKMIQEVFPNLSREDREFIKTGMTKEDWDNTFGYDEE